jgi:PAS domain S-box-containing protein
MPQVLLKMFGCRKGELEGKNVSMLMPQPYSGRHNGYLRNYQTSGVPRILDRSQEVRGGGGGCGGSQQQNLHSIRIQQSS